MEPNGCLLLEEANSHQVEDELQYFLRDPIHNTDKEDDRKRRLSPITHEHSLLLHNHQDEHLPQFYKQIGMTLFQSMNSLPLLNVETF